VHPHGVSVDCLVPDKNTVRQRGSLCDILFLILFCSILRKVLSEFKWGRKRSKEKKARGIGKGRETSKVWVYFSAGVTHRLIDGHGQGTNIAHRHNEYTTGTLASCRQQTLQPFDPSCQMGESREYRRCVQAWILSAFIWERERERERELRFCSWLICSCVKRIYFHTLVLPFSPSLYLSIFLSLESLETFFAAFSILHVREDRLEGFIVLFRVLALVCLFVCFVCYCSRSWTVPSAARFYCLSLSLSLSLSLTLHPFGTEGSNL